MQHEELAGLIERLRHENERLRATLARAPRPAPPFDPVPYIDWYFKDRSAVLGDDEGNEGARPCSVKNSRCEELERERDDANAFFPNHNRRMEKIWALLGGPDPTRPDGENFEARIRGIVAENERLRAAATELLDMIEAQKRDITMVPKHESYWDEMSDDDGQPDEQQEWWDYDADC